ncbi:hypothetical protein [Peribacillus sp. NPDC096540]
MYFGSASPKWRPVAIYSFINNVTYMLINFILSALVVMKL